MFGDVAEKSSVSTNRYETSSRLRYFLNMIVDGVACGVVVVRGMSEENDLFYATSDETFESKWAYL